MVFPWFSYGFPMVFLWFSHFPMVFLWFSHGFPMGFNGVPPWLDPQVAADVELYVCGGWDGEPWRPAVKSYGAIFGWMIIHKSHQFWCEHLWVPGFWPIAIYTSIDYLVVQPIQTRQLGTLANSRDASLRYFSWRWKSQLGKSPTNGKTMGIFHGKPIGSIGL